MPRTVRITAPSISLSMTTDSSEKPIRLPIKPADSQTLLQPARAAMVTAMPFS